MLALALNQLGVVVGEQGDYASGRALIEESLALYRALGDAHWTAGALHNLGYVARVHGDLARARIALEESLPLIRVHGDTAGVASNLGNLGETLEAQGEYDRAQALLAEALVLTHAVGQGKPSRHYAQGLRALAGVLVAQKQPERAARLFGAAEALHELIGAPIPSSQRPHYERQVAVARAALGDEAFAAAWSAGRALPLEEAIAEALDATQTLGTDRTEDAYSRH